MASLMENLIAVLQQECVEYNGLLELSGRKTPIIVAGDLNNLEKITDEEQEWVGRIAHLEKKRTEITADIADVLNKDVKTMKLRDLVQMLSARPAEQKQLEDACDALRDAVNQVQAVNEQWHPWMKPVQAKSSSSHRSGKPQSRKSPSWKWNPNWQKELTSPRQIS